MLTLVHGKKIVLKFLKMIVASIFSLLTAYRSNNPIVWQPKAIFGLKYFFSDIVFFSVDYPSLGSLQ